MSHAFEVTEQRSGIRFHCEPGQSVLKAMEQQGLKCAPVGCRGGGCGFCKVIVLSGDYECGKMSKVHVTPESRACGEVLACRIYPLSNLTIECRPRESAEMAKQQTTTKSMR